MDVLPDRLVRTLVRWAARPRVTLRFRLSCHRSLARIGGSVDRQPHAPNGPGSDAGYITAATPSLYRTSARVGKAPGGIP